MLWLGEAKSSDDLATRTANYEVCISKNLLLTHGRMQMGGLIPNPHDKSVKDKLDKQFRNPKLRNLRKRINKGPNPTEPNFFSHPANPRHLARISHRLKIWPDPDPPGQY